MKPTRTGPAPTRAPSGHAQGIESTSTRKCSRNVALGIGTVYQGSDGAELETALHALERHNRESVSRAKITIKIDSKSVKDGCKLWKDFPVGKKLRLAFRANLVLWERIYREYVRIDP